MTLPTFAVELAVVRAADEAAAIDVTGGRTDRQTHGHRDRFLDHACAYNAGSVNKERYM